MEVTLMQEKTYCLINYGCQMNESDTEHYAGQLEELGYKPVSDYHGADVILVKAPKRKSPVKSAS